MYQYYDTVRKMHDATSGQSFYSTRHKYHGRTTNSNRSKAFKLHCDPSREIFGVFTRSTRRAVAMALAGIGGSIDAYYMRSDAPSVIRIG